MDSSYNFFLLSLFLYSDPCFYTEKYCNMCQIFFCVIFLNYISKIDMKWYHTHIPHESWKKHGVFFQKGLITSSVFTDLLQLVCDTHSYES